jgi:hypothetical protein
VRGGREAALVPAAAPRNDTMGYSLTGILIIVLLVVLIVYFVRRA